MTEAINYSYWELKQYFNKHDLIVIGAGIVGLSTALEFKKKNKKASVLVIERGVLPSGASTKNAGFACFGSPSELIDDLTKMPDETVWKTVEMRWKGLKLLKDRLGAKEIRLQWLGGYELFDNKLNYNEHLDKIEFLNKKIYQAIGLKNTYSDSKNRTTHFGNIKGSILNQYEGQLDTGLMMHQLTELTIKNGIKIINGVEIKKITDTGNYVELISSAGIFKSSKTIVATNGFAKQLLKIKDIQPARAQVLITKPIKKLKIKGAFHYQQGYYYFRNIDDRILFGGGRNLDFKGETSTDFKQNKKIQVKLDELLSKMILPKTPYEIDHRWTGIMGVGSEKKPIIEPVSKNIVAAVRMGGMGVAIGSLVGKIAADKIIGN